MRAIVRGTRDAGADDEKAGDPSAEPKPATEDTMLSKVIAEAKGAELGSAPTSGPSEVTEAANAVTAAVERRREKQGKAARPMWSVTEDQAKVMTEQKDEVSWLLKHLWPLPRTTSLLTPTGWAIDRFRMTLASSSNLRRIWTTRNISMIWRSRP